MQSSKSLILNLEGRIPSKKNSRIHTRSGASIPSKDFSDWQSDAIKQVRIQTNKRFYNPVCIEVILYYGTMARADSDNKLTSILDMLVEAFVLKDDNWVDVPSGRYTAVYRKGEPGATVNIIEL